MCAAELGNRQANSKISNHQIRPADAKTSSGPFVYARLGATKKKREGTMETESIEIDFEKMAGLTPAIVQDSANGEILMLGFMNRAAWERTLASGYVTFYSRTRNQLWMKGETSGNRLRVLSASTDCDRDALLLQVRVEGAGVVCHQGTRSCFTKAIPFSPSESPAAAYQVRP
jgi:phosphoribosyl-ATP pyrophosphohydrolase/phosphoribosyl-AMP cyclohydrolase